MNLFLFHRDLRLFDNTSLILQLIKHKRVTPIFIFTPQQIVPQNNPYFSHNSVQFMVETLSELSEEIESYGGKLYFFYGDSVEVLRSIAKKQKIRSLFFNYDYTPFAKRRDAEIKEWASNSGIQVGSAEDYVLYPLLQGKTLSPKTQKPFLVFTPFKNHCMSTLLINKLNPFVFKPDHFQVQASILQSQYSYPKQKIHSFYEPNKQIRVHGGRSKGLQILKNLQQFKDYNKVRNNPKVPTTALSPYLHFTPISIRQVYYSIFHQLGHDSHIINELHWRDFYVHVTHYNPKVLEPNNHSLDNKFNSFKWNYNPQDLEAWKTGSTGFPIVDAAMRELNTTGFMHNRCRMIVASFLAKDLLLDWQQGERYFANKLVDYSPMQNSGGWQWTVGNGTEAAPYFRIFNPWKQQMDYDPQCSYIKKWLPELQEVPIEDIHKWSSVCKKYIQRGVKYPRPIIDHYEASKQANEILKQHFKK